MNAILLAAGLGTRLRPITNSVPKCLVKIGDKPLLGYWIDGLFNAGIERVLINLHYLPDSVKDFVRTTPFYKRIDFSFEKELQGTGGTLAANYDFCDSQPLFVAHADNFSVFDLNGFIRYHVEARPSSDVTMMTFETDQPKSCGIVEHDEKGYLTNFHEKVENPPSNLASAATFVIEPSVISYCSRNFPSKFDFSKDFLPQNSFNVKCWLNSIYHRDIGDAVSLGQARRDFPDLKKMLSSYGFM